MKKNKRPHDTNDRKRRRPGQGLGQTCLKCGGENALTNTGRQSQDNPRYIELALYCQVCGRAIVVSPDELRKWGLSDSAALVF